MEWFGLLFVCEVKRLKVKKVFNNNILLAEDDALLEMILMGKGIGFGLKQGDRPDEEKIEKVFKIDSAENQDRFVKLVNDIPASHLDLTQKVLDLAEQELHTEFDDTVFVGLADHLSFAIKRLKEHDELKNALIWEIKKFYRKEFIVAQKAAKLIEYYEAIQIPEDEICFIAMHFVNGQQSGEGVRNAAIATSVIQDILNIVKFHFKIDLDEESINYSRFITHIRFFLHRTHHSEGLKKDELFEQVKHKYPETYECVERVKVYLEVKLNIILSYEEMLYFMLHIRRLTERESQS